MAKEYPYTEEELRDFLYKKQEELGRKPTKKDIPEEMRPYYRVYFGKWCYALEATGITKPSERALARRARKKNKHRRMNAAAKAKEAQNQINVEKQH